MIALGFLGAVFMGLTLGFVGGGGSILTVPILVYLFEIQVGTATFYSLLIVGVSAAIGVISFARRNLVEFRTSFIFFFQPCLAYSSQEELSYQGCLRAKMRSF